MALTRATAITNVFSTSQSAEDTREPNITRRPKVVGTPATLVEKSPLEAQRTVEEAVPLNSMGVQAPVSALGPGTGHGAGPQALRHAAVKPPADAPTDAELVIAARTGDRAAQDRLLRRFDRMFKGMAYKIMGATADAEDLLQDTRIAVIKSLGSLENPQAFASWSGSVLTRTAGKKLRRRKTEQKLGLRHSKGHDHDVFESRQAPPDAQVELRRVEKLLCEHPELVQAFILHRIQGETLPTVAEKLGRSRSTVKRQINACAALLEGKKPVPPAS